MKPLTIRIKRRKIISSFTKPSFDETHYWFTINGGNGEVIATSETYTRKHNALKSAHRITWGLYGAKTIDETK